MGWKQNLDHYKLPLLKFWNQFAEVARRSFTVLAVQYFRSEFGTNSDCDSFAIGTRGTFTSSR